MQERKTQVLWLLAFCMALMMTGMNIIWPIFARRFSAFGSGEQALGVMATVYALANIAASPLMGTLADRWGRRPVVLLALGAFIASNVGFVLARSVVVFIIIRVFEGFFTAGLGPAAMGLVSDVAPADRRARWVGVVAGGTSVGWVIGPLIGGVLYDLGGYAAPFVASAGMAAITFAAAFVVIPETHTAARESQFASGDGLARWQRLWAVLPRPLDTLAVLFVLSFLMVFCWAFIEPHLMFYVFDDLGWSTAQFGVAVAGYGSALVVGELALGQLSDHWGRKPVLVVGLVLHTAQYVGLITTQSWGLLLIFKALGGLGDGLVTPALTASYLDITPEEHKGRILGIKGAVAAVGGVLGPGLMVLTSGFFTPRGSFALSGVLLLGGALLAATALRSAPDRPAAAAFPAATGP